VKIAFNGIGCGWGNNGGSQSIFRMAGALQDLGAKVELWSDRPNKFTWFKPKARIRQTTLSNAPDVDVLINTGCTTTKDTLTFPRKKVGVQWLRAHETWSMKEADLASKYRYDMPLWANSEWMVGLVKSLTGRTDVEVQYCGIPVNDFYPVDVAPSDKITVGALWTNKKRKCPKHISMLVRDPALADIRWLLFGVESSCKLQGDVTYIKHPDMDQKRALYSACDVWFAPTDSEGLHIPPMEAALCGATVVAKKKPSAGNMDYCQHDLSGKHYTDIGEVPSIIRSLEDTMHRKELSRNMQALINTKIGTVECNAQRMLNRLESLL
jgi:hypothetical protein